MKTNPIFNAFVVCTIVFLGAFAGACRHDRSHMDAEALAALKQKYDTATLNYFYETVFHEDFSSGKIDNVSKWTSNPKIAILGDTDSININAVKGAMSIINALGLTLQCDFAKEGETPSMEIYFGKAGDVASYIGLKDLSSMGMDTNSAFGFGRPEMSDGVITKCLIGINPLGIPEKAREKIVLEEIVQSLGVIGDSYNYPSSMLFQNDNSEKQFTELDKRILSLLYEPALPAGYAREAFEKDFSDVLYISNTDEKLRKRLMSYPAELYMGKEIEECFIAGKLLKHPKEVNVFLNGGFTHEDSVTIIETVSQLSAVSPNLTIRLTHPGAYEPDHGIVINLKESPNQSQAIQLNNQVIAGKSCMYPKLIKNKIEITLDGSPRNEALRKKSLIQSLYFSVVPIKLNKTRAEELCTISENGIAFKRHYLNLLNLLYANELVDDYEIGNFIKIRSNLKS